MSGIHSICGKCGHEKAYHIKRNCRIGVCSCTGFVDEETAEAWAALEKEETEKALRDEMSYVCPCGHPASDHYMEEGYCRIRYCECPQLGEPIDNDI